MPDLLSYTLLVGLNVLLLVWLIRWRGWVSFEGLGSLLLIVVLGSDWIAMLMQLASSAYPAEMAYEFRSRFHPTIVHALGIVAFAAGLYLVDPRPAPVARVLSDVERERLARYAVLLIVLGLTMKFVSLYAAGVRSIGQFLTQLYFFTVYQARFGGFLDKGPVIANLGIAILAATRRGSPVRQVPYLLAMGAVGFALTTSRADLLGALMTYLTVAAVLNKSMLREALRHRRTIAVGGGVVIFLVLVNSGVKSVLRVRSDEPSFTRPTLSGVIVLAGSLFASRFSAEGLYDGYSNLVNRLHESPGRNFEGRVITYAATAWVPYVIYRNKPQHPFRATGDLVYDDFHSIMEDVSAPTLVGSAYADYGVVSVVLYLLLYGAILATIRRIGAPPNGSALMLLWYLHFTHVDGGTNIIHGGILNLIDAFMLATAVLLALVGAIMALGWLRGLWLTRLSAEREAVENHRPRPAT